MVVSSGAEAQGEAGCESDEAIGLADAATAAGFSAQATASPW
jgi:hypothetical protein